MACDGEDGAVPTECTANSEQDHDKEKAYAKSEWTTDQTSNPVHSKRPIW